jgi:hypothetical protein
MRGSKVVFFAGITHTHSRRRARLPYSGSKGWRCYTRLALLFVICLWKITGSKVNRKPAHPGVEVSQQASRLRVFSIGAGF